MAEKTPVLDPNNSKGCITTSGMARAVHARPNLLSQMERRAKRNARRFLRDMKRQIEAQNTRCKIHPTYEGLRAPRSKAKGCTCRAVYEARKAAQS